MITKLPLRNVRLFGDEARSFPLRELTVFTGTNSSGKSTLLKLLMLVRQTQGIGLVAEGEDGRLRLRAAKSISEPSRPSSRMEILQGLPVERLLSNAAIYNLWSWVQT